MNWELIKTKLCRLTATASILLGGTILTAAASGTMPLWAAIVGLLASVVMLNAVCGILLDTPTEAASATRERPVVQLRVVRGGHAA